MDKMDDKIIQKATQKKVSVQTDNDSLLLDTTTSHVPDGFDQSIFQSGCEVTKDTLRKRAHAIYRDFFSAAKIENFIRYF